MITNPVNIMELKASVVLHPSQLNNDIYTNLKENLSIRILGRCYKDYGLINKIYEIKQYSGAYIFNEDIESKVQYDVIFTCEVIKPVEGSTIITKIVTNHKSCLTTENYNIITFIETNQMNDIYKINQYNGKIFNAKNNEELKKGDMVKVKILNYTFYHNKQKIISLGYLEGQLTEQEIQDYYENKFNEEIEKVPEKPILLSRLSNNVKMVDESKFKFNISLTNLERFITTEELQQTNNKIIVLNQIAEFLDFINFLSPFANIDNIVCICIKPTILEKTKTIIKEMFKNIDFEFCNYIIPSKLLKFKGKEILIISDVEINEDILKQLKPVKINLPFDLESKTVNYEGKIQILPFTNKLRLYTINFKKINYDIPKYQLAYKNYFINFNNPDKIYEDYSTLFSILNIETTFNNIMFYKIFRFYNKMINKEESKKETLKKVQMFLSLFMY